MEGAGQETQAEGEHDDASIYPASFDSLGKRSATAASQEQINVSSTLTIDQSSRRESFQELFSANPSALPEAPSAEPSDAAAVSKRTLQNRRAQRDFRQRRASYIKDLEYRIRQYEGESTGDLRTTVSRLAEENEHLRARVAHLENELAEARRAAQVPIAHADGHSSNVVSPPHEATYEPVFPVQQRPQSAQPGPNARSHLYHTSSAPHLRFASPSRYDLSYKHQSEGSSDTRAFLDPGYPGFRRTSHSTPISPIDVNPRLPFRSLTEPRIAVSAQGDVASTPSSSGLYSPSDPRFSYNLGQPRMSFNSYRFGQVNSHPPSAPQDSPGVPLFPPEVQYSGPVQSAPQVEESLQQQYHHEQSQLRHMPQQLAETHSSLVTGEAFAASVYEGPSEYAEYTYAYQAPLSVQLRNGQLDYPVTSGSSSPSSRVVSPTTFTTQMSLSPNLPQPNTGYY